MLKPSKAIVGQLKAYDRKLDIKWNNKDCLWEVWYKMPWGNRLITPIVENIYTEGGGFGFCPLDTRIVEWIYSADTARASKKWRWLAKKRYFDRKKVQDRKTRALFKNIAQENYNVLNQDLLNPYIDQTDWMGPDIQGKSRKRVMYRSKENAKEFFNDSNSNY
jgi:hypothetical protein